MSISDVVCAALVLRQPGLVDMHYQPVVSFMGRASSAEALVRFRSEEGTPIPTVDALAAIETLGLRLALDRFVLSKALEALKSKALSSVSVNLYASSLLEHDVFAQLGTLSAFQGCSMELLETDALARHPCLLPRLTSLVGVGLCLAIDDYGTGSSLDNLNSLRNLVGKVKLDRQYVRMLGHGAVEMVGATVKALQADGYEVVLEGIETEAEAIASKLLGADWGQGYFFGRPTPLPLR